MFSAFFALSLCLSACIDCRAADEKPADDATLQRLIASLEIEPLAAVAVPDLKSLPDKFIQTAFNKMLRDPSYVKGVEAMRTVINGSIGADVAALWPDFSKKLSGPGVLAMLPSKPGAEGEPDFRLVLQVLVPNADAARELAAQWPRVPPQSGTLLSMLRLQTVVPENLPDETRLPAWAHAKSWPQGDIALRVMPKTLGASLKQWLEKDHGEGMDFLALALHAIRDEEVERLAWGLKFQGELFSEDLAIDLAPIKDSAFARVVSTIRENAANWDGLMAATPGEQDLVLLSQSKFEELGADLPFAGQALERYLRGKKWARARGRTEEALNPNRFHFLFERVHGTFSVVAKPAASGELRLTLASALKPNPASAEGAADALRNDFVKGLRGLGAEFEPIPDARKIGNAVPLGAKFQGRGLFGAPIINFSPGWMWLCSSSAAYQELTNAFKTGKTLSTDATREKNGPKVWRAGDAIRLQINLERVVNLAYAAWILSGEEGPFIGSWKVPGEFLPQPQVFSGRLGTLKTGVARNGNSLSVYALSAIPLASFILPTTLQEASETIEYTRLDAQRAMAQQKALDAAQNAEPEPQSATRVDGSVIKNENGTKP